MQQEILKSLRDNLHGTHISKASYPPKVDTLNEPSSTSCQTKPFCNSIPANVQMMNPKMGLMGSSGTTSFNTTAARQEILQISLEPNIKEITKRASQKRSWSSVAWYYGISTPFGQLECLARMKCEPYHNYHKAEGDPDDKVEKRLDRLSFGYKPAEWMAKCGFRNMWYADMFKLCATGWERGLQTFTVS